MDGIGGKLRAARHRWKLTLKEVELRTLNLSIRCGNPAYRISASWLDRVERQNRGLSATKLIVLASVYNLSAEEMLTLCPTVESSLDVPERAISPNATLLAVGNLDEYAKRWLPDDFASDLSPEDSSLLAPEPAMPGHYRRAVIGLKDRTLYPMVPPGSILMIDTRKRAIATRAEWNHEFDRPIYFFLTRSGYVAGFCEIDRDPAWIAIVPHALSFEVSSRFHRRDVEVLGTVVAVALRR